MGKVRRGEPRGVNVGRGVSVAVAVGAGVIIGVATGVATGRGVVMGRGAAVGFSGVPLATAVSTGFTKVREGALGGGVDSLRILLRAFSAACRSPICSQP